MQASIYRSEAAERPDGVLSQFVIAWSPSIRLARLGYPGAAAAEAGGSKRASFWSV